MDSAEPRVGSSLTPEMARDEFRLIRPQNEPGRFVSADFHIQKDGTFTAEINYNGKVKPCQGTYKYNADKHTVTFTDTAGNNYLYHVKKPNADTLELVTSIKGTDVTLTLKKEP
jgi:hypothetical protein